MFRHRNHYARWDTDAEKFVAVLSDENENQTLGLLITTLDKSLGRAVPAIITSTIAGRPMCHMINTCPLTDPGFIAESIRPFNLNDTDYRKTLN